MREWLRKVWRRWRGQPRPLGDNKGNMDAWEAAARLGNADEQFMRDWAAAKGENDG